MRKEIFNKLSSFLDISVIYFLTDLELIKIDLKFLPNMFTGNGIELILIVPDPEQREIVIKKFKNFLNLNLVVITSDFSRNKLEMYNRAVEISKFQHLLFITDLKLFVKHRLIEISKIFYYYDSAYVIAFSDSAKSQLTFFGTTVESYIKINGFEPKVQGSDLYLNFFRRLEYIGLKQYEIRNGNVGLNSFNPNNVSGHLPLKEILYPLQPKSSAKWSKYEKTDVWDTYEFKNFHGLRSYLKTFLKFNLSASIAGKYNIVALVQVRNEAHHIAELLPHLSLHCDGFILLDDESTDSTFDKAVHPKLLMKVQKSNKGFFDDLENRNILLKLGNFVQTKWFMFIDADERFDSRFKSPYALIDSIEADVFNFNLIDIWDKKDLYRTDIPERKYSNGITLRSRMFRNYGHCQIVADREIHFPAVPFIRRLKNAEVLILHYGNYDALIRKRKYDLYNIQDPDGRKNGRNYEYLIDENYKLSKVDDIVHIVADR